MTFNHGKLRETSTNFILIKEFLINHRYNFLILTTGPGQDKADDSLGNC